MFSLRHVQLLSSSPFLGTGTARDLFEQSLEVMRKRYEFVAAGYVVMPEHVHLLLSEPKKTLLSKAIQALKLSVSVQSRQRPFWQARYYDFNVHHDKKRIEKLRYMHRSPVKRGLVEKPEVWPWSSFRHYAAGLKGTVEIESQWTAFLRGNQLPQHLRYSERAGRELRSPMSQPRDMGHPNLVVDSASRDLSHPPALLEY